MPLALVVGPSGAGKDTLMAGARATLRSDPRFVFVRRVVTRQAVPGLEDHDVLDEAAFAAASARGAFALTWRAHGLSYGLRADIDDHLAAGRVVVANGSRHAIPSALARYPDTVAIVVNADPDTRAARLTARSRETAEEIAARIAREAITLPDALSRVAIDNSGRLADGVAALVAALRGLGDERLYSSEHATGPSQ